MPVSENSWVRGDWTGYGQFLKFRLTSITGDVVVGQSTLYQITNIKIIILIQISKLLFSTNNYIWRD